jgi:PhoH-like ATPase
MTPADRPTAPKLFVLDTNVILHDSGCIRNFEENDVVIPITVLEELDQFKRGNEDINFQAREFLRRIDALTGDVLSGAGSPLGPGLGSIRVLLGGGSTPSSATRPTTASSAPRSTCRPRPRRGR